PSLTPRYVDEHWFSYETLFDEDNALTSIEQEYHSLLLEIENREQPYETAAVFSDMEDEDDDNEDDEEEEDDDDADDENNDDDEDEFEDDEVTFNNLNVDPSV